MKQRPIDISGNLRGNFNMDDLQVTKYKHGKTPGSRRNLLKSSYNDSRSNCKSIERVPISTESKTVKRINAGSNQV